MRVKRSAKGEVLLGRARGDDAVGEGGVRVGRPA